MIPAPEKIVLFVALAALLRRLLHPRPRPDEELQARKWFEGLSDSERARVQRGMVNGNIVEAWWYAKELEQRRKPQGRRSLDAWFGAALQRRR